MPAIGCTRNDETTVEFPTGDRGETQPVTIAL